MTGIEYEQYIYKLITTHVIPSIDSTLAEAIKGEVYYEGKRPINSKEEDIVISFASGVDGQWATSVVMVNTYIPNEDYGNGQAPSRNQARELELSRIIEAFRDSLPVGNILLEKDATIQSYQVPEIEQYYINLRLKLTYNGI